MNTDALIQTMVHDLQPVPRNAVGWRLMGGLLVGGAVTFMLVASVLGFRSDIGAAIHGFSFWMKLTYTISIGLGATTLVARLSRPQRVELRVFWRMAVPLAALSGITIVEMARVPRSEWLAMWLGASWKVCPWSVLLLSAPIFGGLLWSFRRLAPTQLRAAGAAAGLAAGAWAATLYSLHCPEVSALFVLTWYTLGMMLAAGLGASIGSRVLRW